MREQAFVDPRSILIGVQDLTKTQHARVTCRCKAISHMLPALVCCSVWFCAVFTYK
jgi:hypothetical protein